MTTINCLYFLLLYISQIRLDNQNIFTGGWWFERCIQSNLNGFNLRNEASKEDGLGITWLEWKGPKYSLKTTQMKIRKMNS